MRPNGNHPRAGSFEFVIRSTEWRLSIWINAVSFLAVLMALVLMKVPTRQSGSHPSPCLPLTEGSNLSTRSQILSINGLLDFFGSFFWSASPFYPFLPKKFCGGTSGAGSLVCGRVGGCRSLPVWECPWLGMFEKRSTRSVGADGLWRRNGAVRSITRSFVFQVLFLALVGAADTFQHDITKYDAVIVAPAIVCVGRSVR